MWFTMQPRDLSWPATASRRLLSEAVLEATPEEVWRLWADIDAWPRWFPDIRSGSWDSEPPHGVGSRRTMVLNTLTVREHLLAWEPGARFAFTLTSATLPFATSLVEDYRLDALPDGTTHFTWEITYELPPLARPFDFVFRTIFGRMIARATETLQTSARELPTGS